MTEFHEHVTKRLEGFAKRPRMYGSPDAIELAAILTLVDEVMHYKPELLSDESRVVTNFFMAEVSRRTGQSVTRLSDPTRKIENVEQMIVDICVVVRKKLGHLPEGTPCGVE